MLVKEATGVATAFALLVPKNNVKRRTSLTVSKTTEYIHIKVSCPGDAPGRCHIDGLMKDAAVTLLLIPLYTGAATLVPPVCDHKTDQSPLKAERRPNGCLGRSRVVHRTFRHRHGRHGRREVLNMFKTVAQRSPRRWVAHRSVKGGRTKADTSSWSQKRCTVVGHWSPGKKNTYCCELCV